MQMVRQTGSRRWGRQVEGGGEAESISIEQAIELKLISADYLEAWWRSSRLW